MEGDGETLREAFGVRRSQSQDSMACTRPRIYRLDETRCSQTGTRITRSGMGWGARLLIALVLILAGAAATVWSLARYEPAAKFFGIAPSSPQLLVSNTRPVPVQQPVAVQTPPPAAPEIAELKGRLEQVENATERAAGSAGRADAAQSRNMSLVA